MEDIKKKTPNTTITRNTAEFSQMTGNIYETVAVLTKRANQIAIEEKKELHHKIEEFSNSNDGLDEYYENREQIDIVILRPRTLLPQPGQGRPGTAENGGNGERRYRLTGLIQGVDTASLFFPTTASQPVAATILMHQPWAKVWGLIINGTVSI